MAVYGRRRGGRLRPARRALLETLMPRLAVRLPETGRIADPRAALGFPPGAPLWLEIGFGGGEHAAWQAAQNPRAAIVACDAWIGGGARLLAAIESGGLANIRIFPDDARPLLAALPDACLARVFALFPDPWPKTRHWKRRLIQPAFLDELARAMADGAELRLATDHPGYRRWMLARLLVHPAFAWTARAPEDWRRRPADWPPTRYERKALAAGRDCVWLAFRRRARPPAP